MTLLLVLDESTGFYALDGERGNLPQLSVEIDFTNNPTNGTRVWTDVTPDVRALSYVRSGRNNELQRTEPGTLDAVLNNRHGNYDPTNTASPYYPGVKRMRWMRVRASWAGVTYPRWQGLIETWQQRWPGFGKDATVAIRATDALKALNLFDLAGLSYGSQTTYNRVSSVLVSAGITSYTVDTSASSSVVASGAFAEGSSALAHLQDVEETENGLLFAEGDGSIVFQGRYWRAVNSGTPLGTIGDVAGEIRYRDAELVLDDADIWNIISVTPSGGSAQVVTNSASRNAHYARRLNKTSLSASTSEALDRAQYLANRYGDSAPRVPTLELLGAAATSFWPTILSASNSDVFVWRRRATARTIEQNIVIERVADTITPGGDWRVTLQCSPAADTAYWALDDDTYSLLDDTTVLAY